MLNLLPNALFTTHNGLSGGRGLSPRLWSRPDGQALSPDGFSNGFYHADDFLNFGAVGTGTVVGYGAFADSSCTIANIATAMGGVVRFTTTANDNVECSLSQGGLTGACWKIDGGTTTGTAGHDQMLIYETRFRVGSVSANSRNIFLGLTQEGLAVTDGFFSDSAVIADKDYIGFYALESDPAVLKFNYQKAGASGDYAGFNVATLTANTWYKVGFIYNPAAPASKAIKVYVDNVEATTAVPRSSIVTSAGAAVANFPSGEELTAFFNLKNGSAAGITTLDIDWVAIFQHGPTANA